MKKSFATICSSALLLLACGLMVSSCAQDDDSNPTLNTENLSMELLQPALGQNNTIDLSASSTLTLKLKEQPQYGYPAITKYTVEVSVDPNFKTAAADDNTVKYKALATSYSTATMNVDAMEMNNAIVKLYQSANNNADPTGKEMPIYIRVKAIVVATGGSEVPGTSVCSNVVELPKTLVSYVATMPSNIYITGPSIQGGTAVKAFAPVYGMDGQFYSMVYFTAGSTFKFGDETDCSWGYDMFTDITDEASANVERADDGSVTVKTAGWYVMHITCTVDAAKNKLTAALGMYAPLAYIIGVPWNSDWSEATAGQMTAPANADGEWESPAFNNSGELRAYIKVSGIDWWRTEFTILKGDLYWRVTDIPQNWNDNLGSAYSVACEPGQKLYVNFDKNTGYVK